jgi:hypothetical protein
MDNGTFVAVKFSEEITRILHQYVIDNNVPNYVKPLDYHSTIVYSKKTLKNVLSQRKIEWAGKPIGLDIFSAKNNGITTKCLVLKFESTEMNNRHMYLKQYANATHDFPSYIPHITLSYDIGNLDIDKLSNIHEVLQNINIIQEYSTKLKIL